MALALLKSEKSGRVGNQGIADDCAETLGARAERTCWRRPMDVVGDVLQFVADNVFRQVALLIGLVTLIGQAVQRKPVEDVVASAIRATIGVVILLIGVQVFTGGL